MSLAKRTSTEVRRGSRPRAPRGEGSRLREELLGAAQHLVESSGDSRLLSLRAVARHVGVAATSVYLHFADLDALKVALVEVGSRDLRDARDSAVVSVDDPVRALVARCTAYCQFGIDHAGVYRLMFGPDLPPTIAYAAGPGPGRQALETLANSIERCLAAGAAQESEDPEVLAGLLWVALHGLVMLSIDRPSFPLTPTDQMVEALVRRIVVLSEPDSDPRRRAKSFRS